MKLVPRSRPSFSTFPFVIHFVPLLTYSTVVRSYSCLCDMLPAPPGYWVPATKREVWREACGKYDDPCKAAAESCKEKWKTPTTTSTTASEISSPAPASRPPSTSPATGGTTQPCSARQCTSCHSGRTTRTTPLPARPACSAAMPNGSDPTQQTSAECAGRCANGFATKGRGAETLSGCGCYAGEYSRGAVTLSLENR